MESRHRYRVHRDTEIVAWAPRAGRATVARSSSLTTEIYNEFPVQPGRKFARARPLVPTTLHKRYRGRIAHSDLKQPFRQCGDASVRRRGCTQRARKNISFRSSRIPLLFLPSSPVFLLFFFQIEIETKLIFFREKFCFEGLIK